MKYNLMPLFFLLLLFSCNKQEPTVDPAPEPAPTVDSLASSQAHEPVIYRTTVDELRLRETSGTESRVILKLPIRQKLYSLEEVSDDTYSATMAGKKVTDVWRKVKVVESNGREIIGWVFGGGVEEEIITYELMPAGNYLREIIELPGEEMAQLLGIDVFPEFDYGGRLSYRKTTTDLYVLNGPFEVITHERPNTEGFSKNISVTYVGQFTDGKLEGEIKRYFTGYESRSEATILFNNGRCSSGLLVEEGEGMTNRFEEPAMATCTFRYLDDGLRAKFSE